METFSALLAIWTGIRRLPVNSPHKGQRRRALMFSFISAWRNGWVNNREAGDLRRHRAHYYVNIMLNFLVSSCSFPCAIYWSQVSKMKIASTTFEWWTLLLPTKVRLILEVWWYTWYNIIPFCSNLFCGNIYIYIYINSFPQMIHVTYSSIQFWITSMIISKVAL